MTVDNNVGMSCGQRDGIGKLFAIENLFYFAIDKSIQQSFIIIFFKFSQSCLVNSKKEIFYTHLESTANCASEDNDFRDEGKEPLS